MKNDFYYIERVLKDIDFIIQHTKDVHDVDELTENDLLLDSMSFRLIQIAENITKISDEFKRMYPELPWQDVKGFRNRLVHDYGNVDFSFVYIAVKEDIPALKKQFLELK